jgi:hypothetical protein
VEEQMRNVTWIIATGLAAASTAGCIDTNSPYGGGSGYGYAPGYSSGYSQGYAPAYSSGYSSGYAPTYYQRPAVNNYYVQPRAQPQVINNYVPVPSAPERRWGNNNGPDHRWDNNNRGQAQGQSGDHRPQQHDWHPGGNQQAGNQAPHTPTPTPQQPRQRGLSQDRDGDGRPDQPNRGGH